MSDASEQKVLVERLPNLGDWEFYKLARDEDDALVCKIAMRADSEIREAEYGLWLAADDEPSATGTIAWDAYGEWSDASREAALREIVTAHDRELPNARDRLEFLFGDDRADDDEGENNEDEGEGADEDDDYEDATD